MDIWPILPKTGIIPRYNAVVCYMFQAVGKGQRTELRVLSEKKPVENAVPVEGNLQDLYLFLFENEKKAKVIS